MQSEDLFTRLVICFQYVYGSRINQREKWREGTSYYTAVTNTLTQKVLPMNPFEKKFERDKGTNHLTIRHSNENYGEETG